MREREALAATTAGAGAAALLPLAWLYGAGSAIVRRVQTARRPPPSAGRVVSVGALEAGGSGKTPLAMRLLSDLTARGLVCAYASRGYGSRAERSRAVSVVQEDSPRAARAVAGTRLLSRSHPALELELGDEASMLAGRLPGVALFVGGDKRRAVGAALASGVDVVVVDDAFQTWRLARSVDVVLLDGRRPLANGRLLPAGPLREPARALARADAIVFNGVENGDDIQRARSQIARWIGEETPVHGLRRVIRLVGPGADAARVPSRALLVSGIARPEAFAGAVRELGVEVAAHEIFRDHHAYTGQDAARLSRRCAQVGGGVIITTEKDWVKLRRFVWSGMAPWVARLDVEWVGRPPSL